MRVFFHHLPYCLQIVAGNIFFADNYRIFSVIRAYFAFPGSMFSDAELLINKIVNNK